MDANTKEYLNRKIWECDAENPEEIKYLLSDLLSSIPDTTPVGPLLRERFAVDIFSPDGRGLGHIVPESGSYSDYPSEEAIAKLLEKFPEGSFADIRKVYVRA